MALWSKSAPAPRQNALPMQMDERTELQGAILDGISEYGIFIKGVSPYGGSQLNSVGDDIEEMPLPERRPDPAHLKNGINELLKMRLLWGDRWGTDGMAVRYEHRDSQRMSHAPTRGGDTAVTLMTEEKLVELGMVDDYGNPLNMTPNAKSIVSDRCTCIKYV